MTENTFQVDDDYVYEIEDAYWRIMMDCQDLILSTNLHDMASVEQAYKRIHEKVLKWRASPDYYWFRSQKMNGTGDTQP